MRKAVIGVMPLWDDDKESVWMLPGYLGGIEEAGGIPMIFPMTSVEKDLEQLMRMCDGILFTGGHDVDPALYGEKALDCVESCRERDEMEKIVFRKVMTGNKPFLGICRGIQFINVGLGGTLYQDLPTQRPTNVDHHMAPPYDRAAHMVTIEKNTPLYRCLGKEQMGVNSYHHQAIKELGQGLYPMATSEDGLVEAVYVPTHPFFWALQWHPEFSYKNDEDSRKIFEAFIREAESFIH